MKSMHKFKVFRIVAMVVLVVASLHLPQTGQAKQKCVGPHCPCTCEHIKNIEREIGDAEWSAERHTKKQLEMRDKEYAATREHSGDQAAYEKAVNRYWNQYNYWAKHRLPKEFKADRGYQAVSDVQFDGRKNVPDAAQLKHAQDTSACKLIAARFVRHENAHAAKRKDGGGNTLPSQLAEEERYIYLNDAEFLKIGLEKVKAQCKGKAFGPVIFTANLPGGVAMTQKISGKNCKDPLADNWVVQQSFIMKGIPTNAPNKGSRSDTDCVAPNDPVLKKRMDVLRRSGGGGWLCVYDAGPPEQVSIHLFSNPMMGYKPPIQKKTVPVTSGECEN